MMTTILLIGVALVSLVVASVTSHILKQNALIESLTKNMQELARENNVLKFDRDEARSEREALDRRLELRTKASGSLSRQVENLTQRLRTTRRELKGAHSNLEMVLSDPLHKRKKTKVTSTR